MTNKDFGKLIKDKNYIILELGPGDKKCCKNAIGIDIIKKSSVDYITNLDKGLSFINDSIIDEIHAYHFLEHVSNLEFFMGELHRVLKRGGKLIATVPHFSNPYFYSDYTHKHFWGLYTVCYFSKTRHFKRLVPQYYNSLSFHINKIKLKFKSPFRIRNKFKLLLETMFNMTSYMQELYEENFVYFFPSYEIFFELEKE